MLPKAKRLPANAVAGCTSPSGRNTQFTVPRPAGCVIAVEALSGLVRVRNLTVSHAHAYYANRMLTHNCDALGLVGQLLDHMLVGIAPTKAAKPGKVDDYVIWQPKAEPGDWLGW